MKHGHEENDTDIFVKIEFRTSQVNMPFVKSNVVGIETAPEGRSNAGPTSFGWVRDDDVSASAPGFPNAPPPPPPSQPGGASAPGLGSHFQVAGPSRSQPPSSSPAPGLGGGGGGPRAVNVAYESRLVPKGMPRTLSAPSSMTGPGMPNLLANIVNSRASQPVVPRGAGYAAYSTSSNSNSNAVAGPSNSNAIAGPSNPKPSAAASTSTSATTLGKARPSALVKNPSRRLSTQKANSSIFTLEENLHYAHPEEDADNILPNVAGSSSQFDFAPITWPAGSYSITMVLDNREIKSKNNRSGILDALRQDGMEVEQRALPLGDVLWIAKRVDGGGLDDDEDECVLSWVIERKRLDDLVASITDGRFHEQKVSRNASLLLSFFQKHFVDSSPSSFLGGTLTSSTECRTLDSNKLSTLSRTSTSSKRSGLLPSRPPSLQLRSSMDSSSREQTRWRIRSPTSRECTILSSNYWK